MASVSQTRNPYTVRYVQQVLALSAEELDQLTELLALPRTEDPVTGEQLFSADDFELLRRLKTLSEQGNGASAASEALRAQQQQPGQDTHAMATPAGVDTNGLQGVLNPARDPMAGYGTAAPTPTLSRIGEGLNGFPNTSNGSLSAVAGLSTSSAAAAPSSGQVAILVESIAASKDTILREMSRLLDERLAGLDEVVVELIRCKTENESLRNKLATALREKDDLKRELESFKPVQFGFYKKVGR